MLLKYPLIFYHNIEFISTGQVFKNRYNKIYGGFEFRSFNFKICKLSGT